MATPRTDAASTSGILPESMRTRPSGGSKYLAPQPRTTHELALYNYRLGFFNLLANWANMHRTKHLEGAVKRGRQQIEELHEKIDGQDNDLGELNSGLEQVANELEVQKKQVTSALERFGQQVSEQNNLIRQQQKTVQRMLASKFQSDAVVDTSIAAVSGWLSTTPIISLPVYLLTMWLPVKTRWLAATLLKLAAFFKMASSLRGIAVEKRLHNAVGTPSAYIAAAISYVTQKTKEKMAARRKLKQSAIEKVDLENV